MGFYQAVLLKRYPPAEFMAAGLSNGKGFYDPLVYVLESYRVGIRFLPPCMNEPGPKFKAQGKFIRVPVTRMKGLGEKTKDRIIEEFNRAPFSSLADFYRRVNPLAEEIEAMIRFGAFDGFGKTRTALLWESQFLHRSFVDACEPGQGWLLPPPSLEKLPQVSLDEPNRKQRLEWEAELLDFCASGHPLELHDDVAWETYCPVNRLHQFIGQKVTMCGLVIEQRIHHQITGEPMKFLTLADWTGIVETELFASTYRNYGLATVRYPVLEVDGNVEPYENGRRFPLRVLRAGSPRLRKEA